jgi:hypothetical protein
MSANLAAESPPLKRGDLDSMSASRNPRPRVNFSLAVKILGGSLLFVIAKNMASESYVHLIDQLQYWLLGVVSLFMFFPFTIINRGAVGTQTVDNPRMSYAHPWLFALVAFILLQEMHYSERLELLIDRPLNFNAPRFTEFVITSTYVGIGIACAIIVAALRGLLDLKSPRRVVSLFALFALNCMMFYLLIFRLPST